MLQYGENWMLITNLCNEHWFQELKYYLSSLLKNQLLKANIFTGKIQYDSELQSIWLVTWILPCQNTTNLESFRISMILQDEIW